MGPTVTTPAEIQEIRGTQRVPGAISEVALLAYPVILQTISETVMQVVDSAMVGRLGPAELGAVGFGGIWTWTTVTFFVGASQGVQTFASQEDGAGRGGASGRWVWQATWLLLPLAILWGVAAFFGFGPLVGALGPVEEIRALAVPYVQIRLLGVPAFVIGPAITGFFRGVGDTKTPLVATVIAVCANVVFAYGWIFGELGLPAWGVNGAAAAMVVGNYVFTAVLGVALLRRGVVARYGTLPVRPDVASLRRYARTALPIGGQWLLDMGSFALFTTLVARMGAVSMAASQAMLQLLSISFMQVVAIGIASGTLVGRYVGARDLAAAERSHASAVKLGVLVSFLVGVLFLSVPEVLFRIFSDDAGVLALAGRMLTLGAAFQVADALAIVAGGSLRGAGDTRWCFLVHVGLAWVVRLPMVWLFAVELGGGVHGAWMGELVFVLLLSACFTLRFRSRAWHRVAI